MTESRVALILSLIVNPNSHPARLSRYENDLAIVIFTMMAKKRGVKRRTIAAPPFILTARPNSLCLPFFIINASISLKRKRKKSD